MLKFIPLLIGGAAVAGCQASNAADANPPSEEMAELQTWGKQLKAEDPDTARLLVRQCWSEGSLMTDEGKLAVARCMRRKYDEGVRA